MPTYPRLPSPPAPAADDTAIAYGCRLLIWYLETDQYTTSSTDQLRAADHAAHFAVTAPGILPTAVDRISAVRHAIAATLRRRDLIAAEDVQIAPQSAHAAAGTTIGTGPDSGPGNPGGRVPRQPYPIGPSAPARLPVPDIAF